LEIWEEFRVSNTNVYHMVDNVPAGVVHHWLLV
jgi:hypothetical protein